MDNRIFNVNGKGKNMLADVLQLALFQEGGCYENSPEKKAAGWTFSKEKGLMLLWHVELNNPNHTAFLTPLGAHALAEMVSEWLTSDQAGTVVLEGWDRDCDHDGHNTNGWRVYCEDWGHVSGDHYAFVAITPAYMWHGK